MYVDIVFPEDNEKKFIELALRLKYDGLCFVYEFKNKKYLDVRVKKIEKLREETELSLFIGAITKPKQVNSAKTIADLVIVSAQGQSSKENRYVLEKTKADLLYGLELQPKNDSMHHRNSGLNQVMCTLANKKKIMIGFSLAILLEKKDMLRTIFMGRATQNIKFCRKYKCDMVIASFAQNPFKMRAADDLESLGILLGMHPKEARDSLTNIAKRLEFNIKKKNKQVIAEGIVIID